jgi:hypothetical protein
MYESYLKICNYFSSIPRRSLFFGQSGPTLLSPKQIATIYQNCHIKKWEKLGEFFLLSDLESNDSGEAKKVMELAKQLSSKFIIEELLLKGKEEKYKKTKKEIDDASFLELCGQIFPDKKWNAVSIWKKIGGMKDYPWQDYSVWEEIEIRKDENLCLNICVVDYLKRRFLNRFCEARINLPFRNYQDDDENLLKLLIEDAESYKLIHKRFKKDITVALSQHR